MPLFQQIKIAAIFVGIGVEERKQAKNANIDIQYILPTNKCKTWSKVA